MKFEGHPHRQEEEEQRHYTVRVYWDGLARISGVTTLSFYGPPGLNQDKSALIEFVEELMDREEIYPDFNSIDEIVEYDWDDIELLE